MPIGGGGAAVGLPAPPRDGTEAAVMEGIVGNSPSCQYIKKRHLGQGSFGSAWKVEDVATGTPYAAKIMNTNNMSAKDRGFVANEVRCLSCCNHSNVVKHILSRDVDGMILIVMEYADGGDLYKQIKARQQGMRYFREHEILFIFLQLCLALDHIHSKRMMHRDLKTANVLLTATGLVKLGDFGFSRQYDDSLSNPVGSTFCGTPYYLSPELWRRAPYSKKSEMWALGVVLYEVMALKRPFGGKNMDELIDRIVHARYDPLPDEYSPELRNVVAQLLQLEPAQRPSLRQLFQQPYVRNSGLLTLKKSVENHSRIPPQVRADMVANIDNVLRCELNEYEGARVVPKRGLLKRHVADSGWRDCDLELAPTSIIMRDPANPTAPPETIELSALTSVCPIDASIATEHFVFAMKNQTGLAFWFKEATHHAYQEWLSVLQNSMPY